MSAASNQTSSSSPSKLSSCAPGYSTGAAILPQHESKGFMRENKKPWDPWTDDEIRDLYDMNPGIDMQQLALVTMLSIAELKQILMENQ